MENVGFKESHELEFEEPLFCQISLLYFDVLAMAEMQAHIRVRSVVPETHILCENEVAKVDMVSSQSSPYL